MLFWGMKSDRILSSLTENYLSSACYEKANMIFIITFQLWTQLILNPHILYIINSLSRLQHYQDNSIAGLIITQDQIRSLERV